MMSMNMINRAMKNFCKYVVVVLVVFYTATSIGQISTEYVTVKGTSTTQSKAVEDALMEATFQIYGVRVTANTQAAIFSARSNDTSTFPAKIHREMSRQSLPNKRNELLGYDVISSQRDADGLYTVTIQTKYSEYRVPGPENKRRSLVVEKFVVTGELSKKRKANISGILFSRLEALLIQSRQFSVLSRDDDGKDYAEKETSLLQSDNMSTAERARLGKVVGADYIVYGKILPASVEKIDKSIAILGEHKVSTVVTVPVEFRIIAVATRQIKWSSKVVVEHVIVNTEPNQVVDVNQAVDIVVDEAAELIFGELTENIYPPRISKVLAANRFVVNRGSDTVEKGMQFEVFDLGENIVDPYTGESLGQVESFVGLANIVEIKPKYSIAKLATDALIKTGMILRKYREEDDAIKQQLDTKPSFKDEDSDGLPDYLELLNEK